MIYGADERMFVLPEIFDYYESRRLASRPWTSTPFKVDTDVRKLVRVVGTGCAVPVGR